MEQGDMGRDSDSRGFMRLFAWQKADDLACAVFPLASTLPAQHRWLSQQMARAAISVPANIAEGYSRGTLKEYLRFLEIARGSLAEVEYYLHFMIRSGLISEKDAAPVQALRAETGTVLFRLMESLRKKLRVNGKWQRGILRDDSAAYDFLALEEDWL